jgi:hypothetical protein
VPALGLFPWIGSAKLGVGLAACIIRLNRNYWRSLPPVLVVPRGEERSC